MPISINIVLRQREYNNYYEIISHLLMTAIVFWRMQQLNNFDIVKIPDL